MPSVLRVVLSSMSLTSCKPTPTPRVAGSVKQKPDADAELDTQECRLFCGIVESLQYLAVEIAVACNSRQTLVRRWLESTEKTVLLEPGADHDPHEAFFRV